AAPEQGFGPLDPAGHEVAVRALAERSLEAAGEVTVDIVADRARAGTSSGRSNSRSMRSLALRSLTRSRMSMETAFNGTQAAVPPGQGGAGPISGSPGGWVQPTTSPDLSGQKRRAMTATGTIARVARAETNKAWPAPVPATSGPPTAVP